MKTLAAGFGLATIVLMFFGSASLTGAEAASLERSLHDVASARNVSEFSSSVSNLVADVRRDKEGARALLKRYEPFYEGKRNLGPPVHAETEKERDGATAARALMYAVGKCHYADLVAPYMRHQAPPDCVIFAFAEAKGIRLYYSLTEAAFLDMIVTRDRALAILRANGFL